MYGARPVVPVLALALGVQLLPVPAGGLLGAVRNGLLVLAAVLTGLWLAAVVVLVGVAAVIRLRRPSPAPPSDAEAPGRHLLMEVSR